MEPRSTAKLTFRERRTKTLALLVLGPFAFIFFDYSPMMISHMVLIVANVLVVVGMFDLKQQLQIHFDDDTY
jgi:hypothetical protein